MSSYIKEDRVLFEQGVLKNDIKIEEAGSEIKTSPYRNYSARRTRGKQLRVCKPSSMYLALAILLFENICFYLQSLPCYPNSAPAKKKPIDYLRSISALHRAMEKWFHAQQIRPALPLLSDHIDLLWLLLDRSRKCSCFLGCQTL